MSKRQEQEAHRAGNMSGPEIHERTHNLVSNWRDTK